MRTVLSCGSLLKCTLNKELQPIPAIFQACLYNIHFCKPAISAIHKFVYWFGPGRSRNSILLYWLPVHNQAQLQILTFKVLNDFKRTSGPTWTCLCANTALRGTPPPSLAVFKGEENGGLQQSYFFFWLVVVHPSSAISPRAELASFCCLVRALFYLSRMFRGLNLGSATRTPNTYLKCELNSRSASSAVVVGGWCVCVGGGRTLPEMRFIGRLVLSPPLFSHPNPSQLLLISETGTCSI